MVATLHPPQEVHGVPGPEQLKPSQAPTLFFWETIKQ
jgi:hypothetical protein